MVNHSRVVMLKNARILVAKSEVQDDCSDACSHLAEDGCPKALFIENSLAKLECVHGKKQHIIFKEMVRRFQRHR